MPSRVVDGGLGPPLSTPARRRATLDDRSCERRGWRRCRRRRHKARRLCHTPVPARAVITTRRPHVDVWSAAQNWNGANESAARDFRDPRRNQTSRRSPCPPGYLLLSFFLFAPKNFAISDKIRFSFATILKTLDFDHDPIPPYDLSTDICLGVTFCCGGSLVTRRPFRLLLFRFANSLVFPLFCFSLNQIVLLYLLLDRYAGSYFRQDIRYNSPFVCYEICVTISRCYYIYLLRYVSQIFTRHYILQWIYG